MLDAAGDAPTIPGKDLPGLVADREAQPAPQQAARLFVRMGMARQHAAPPQAKLGHQGPAAVGQRLAFDPGEGELETLIAMFDEQAWHAFGGCACRRTLPPRRVAINGNRLGPNRARRLLCLIDLKHLRTAGEFPRERIWWGAQSSARRLRRAGAFRGLCCDARWSDPGPPTLEQDWPAGRQQVVQPTPLSLVDLPATARVKPGSAKRGFALQRRAF